MGVLDKLKKERSVQRRLFTNAANDFESMLKNELTIDTHIARANLCELQEGLSELDKQIKDVLTTDETFLEEDLEKELLNRQKYKTKWRSLDALYQEKTRTGEAEAPKRNLNYQLPKLSFQIFDGKLKGWLPFWNQFSKIDQDPTIDCTDKYQYLIQSMKENTEVRALVEGFPPNAYKECVEQLKTRFARDELLIQVYVRELLALVLMQKQNVTITQLYDQLNAQLRALESLGVTKDKYAAFLLPMVESSLTQDILRTWERFKTPTDDITKELTNLLDFLKKEVDSEQRIEISRKTFSKEEQNIEEKLCTTEVLLSNTKDRKMTSLVCVWCDRNTHSSLECYKMLKMNIEERRNLLKSLKVCPICLRKGHHPKQCKATVKCLICQKRHSTVLCPDQKQDLKLDNEQKGQSSTLSTSNRRGQTLLQTVIVEVEYQNKKTLVRALLDSGSQRSYVKKDVVEKMDIPLIAKEELTHCLFGGLETKSKQFNVYKLKINGLNSDFTLDLMAISQDCICLDIPKVDSSDIKLNKMLNEKGITLTDKMSNIREIGLLIGADFLGFVLTGMMIQLQNGLVAVKTKFGWTLQGNLVSLNTFSNAVTLLHCTCDNNDISDFWSLEMLGIKEPAETKSNAEVIADTMMSFEENIKKNDENRYEVKLPFKTNYEDLLPNYERAKVRLDSMTKKLKTAGRFQDYDSIFNNWLELGIIEEADNEPDCGHYLPHRPVLREQSLTTSIRPVFDASATDKNGLSLNACLEKGINLIDIIPNLLVGFRTGAIGVTSDIEKAFLQISLKPEDREYLKFLWYKNDELITYRHCRVVFGLTSSPFLLSATLQHHLNEMKRGPSKNTAETLSRSFYVDNSLVSMDTSEETKTFIEEAKNIMQAGKFNLRMWVTSQGLDETGKNIVSVLGLIWDTKSDELFCNLSSLPSPDNIQKLTKRCLLSLTQKVFDPIGFTSPVMLAPKLMLQETWRRQINWDDVLPDDIFAQFNEWYKEILFLKDCKVPRRLTRDVMKHCKVSIHLFCDASKNGYGACVLLRAEKDDRVTVQLISAKSRVTPTHKLTIPRSELMATLIGSRLLVQVRDNLPIQHYSEYCWTDSGVALYWIKRELELKTFVGNRVKEIRLNTNVENWHHIPGEHNWADLASRGCNAKVLLDRRWWEGPQWLYLPAESWPQSDLLVDEVHPETKVYCIPVNAVDANLLDKLQNYFSKYTKIVRMTAWILRFIYNTQKAENKRKGEITYKEYEKAEKVLIKLIQVRYYGTQENKCNLTKYEDEEGLIRVKTKLLLTDFPESIRTPYLLPAKEPTVFMMVRQRHTQLQHAGANQLIADIRTRFWITGVRRLVRSVINSCVICNRYKSKPTQAPTAPLPVERVVSSAPFQTTGVDLAGPLYLRGGEKCWIVIYTCAVYRAVHLELTKSLSTEAFIMTLRRFIARRGRVDMFMSDQGTNFHGTKSLLTALNWNEVERESTIRRISWKMNAPSAAWWGGYWERLIRVMKDLLRRIIGKAAVSYEELETLLCDCEATMNSRPLTYINDDKGGYLEPLTPNYFIQPLSNSDVTDFDKIDASSLNNRLRYIQTLRDQFRQRFKSEYLSLLVQKGIEQTVSIKIGDIVLVETDEKRVKWPLGIVKEFYTGRDGVNRTALVKTSTGVRVRPLQRLYKLEVSGNFFPVSKNCRISIPVPDDGVKALHDIPDLPDKPTHCTRSGRKVKLPSKFDIYV